jgi:hypothetical protein
VFCLRFDRVLDRAVWLPAVFCIVLGALLAASFWYIRHQNEAGLQVPIRARAFPKNQVPVLPEQRNLVIAADTALKINEARPFESAAVEKARPFVPHKDTLSQDRAADCLAAAAWYEAGDDAEGEKSVIQTVLNRVRHPAFPSTVCGVVFQGQERKTGCQFTFTCDGALQRIPSEAAWKRAVAIARAMLGGDIFAAIGHSTHYHTDWVVPYWSPTLAKVAKVRTHIFYRWPGYWGTRPAFKQTVQALEPIIPALAKLSPAHLATSDPALGALLGEDATPVGPAYVEKPAIELPGVSQRSMRGSTVRLAPQPDTFFMQLEDRAFAGNYAISALAVCKQKTVCQVYGWTNGAAIADHLPLTNEQRALLSFYYVRAADGSDKALWNCLQTPRKNPDQCMLSSVLPLPK